MFEILATKNDQGKILYKVIIGYMDNVPISHIEKLFRNKDVKVNDKRTKDKKYVVNEGDKIIVYGVTAGKKRHAFKNVEINFKPIYEDENILVINKPPRVVMHGERNSLDEQVLRYLSFVKRDSFIPSSIGRLDKVTSGLVVYAKNYLALRAFKTDKHIVKTYVYRSNKPFDEERQEVTFYHVYNPKTQRVEMHKEPVRDSKIATTILYDIKQRHYAQLVTGRKHQIRATLSKLGYPIHGDRNYGGKPDKQVYLHSYKIQFKDLEGELENLNGLEFIEEPK